MRNPSDLPPRGPASIRARRFSDKGRIALIAVAVIIVGLLLFGRFFAGFYTDYLWFDSVGRAGVFSTMLRSKLLMFFLFGGTFVALAILNLVIADRLAPSAFSANTHPVVERFHEFFGHRLRSLRIAVATVAGVLFAAPAVGHWQDWLMFRNSQKFGIADAQFRHDVGFYMFRLPFIAFVLDWLFAALVFITLLVIATHVLSGGIIIQPPRPKVRRATKAHVAVLLAALAVVKAGDYWLTRYELTTDSRGFVRGLLYSAAKAQLPAVMLLTLIALLVAGLFLSTLRTNSWRIPVVASALWAVIALIGGVIYPAAIQALVVNPNQRDKEAPYIVRNIDATLHALGIDNVARKEVTFADITEKALEADITPLKNVRLLKPEAMVGRFRTDQSQKAGLTINDVDPDRYDLDGRVQQVSMAARELDLSAIANKSWQGQHLISTHGCGLVEAPSGQISDRRPVYREVPLDRPEMYYSDDISGYAVVDTGVNEEDCPGHADPGPYSGTGGIKLDSVFKRMAFALSYLDYNMIGSGAINDSSRLISIRRVEDRAKKLAPFLSYDNDPYPVALNGRVLWVIDAYTTSDRYPYGESGDRKQLNPGSGLDHPFNYVRNSIKVVVDAYNGTVDFYIVDPVDPIAKVWQSAFPGLFKTRDQMPQGLDAHLRYPEELFRVQTAAYSKYRLSPDAFFGRTGAWSVAQAPIARPRATPTVTNDSVAGDSSTGQQADLATESGTERFVPYYSELRSPGETQASFKLLRPFVPFSTDDSKRNLQAFMTASSDPQDYGSLVAYEVTNAEDGPFTVSNTMNTEASVSQQLSLLNIEGTDVVFGDLQMVPLAGGLLWVRPVYVQPTVSDSRESQPTIELVLVSQNNKAAFGSSLSGALAKLFPGFEGNIGDVVGETPADNGGTGGVVTPPTTDTTPADLLDQAEALFAQADQALDDHDLATYQEKVNQARALVQQAVAALQGG
ncbi:MAG TPA: UPF0182 family protein [Ilumatobacteraceae bacterium]|nr:UPF0182 family protein [Ilumatobacteraceae bacterium]